MSKTVCVLAQWEAEEYTHWEAFVKARAEAIVAGLTPVQATAWLAEKNYPKGRLPDCSSHKHVPILEADEMVSGTRFGIYRRTPLGLTGDGALVCWLLPQPVAAWIGRGKRRLAMFSRPSKVRDLSARLGFDVAGNTIKGFGRETGEEARAREIPNASRRRIDLASISANSAADWIQAMLSDSPPRLPSTSSRMRTGNSGGDGSFLEGRK